MAIRLITGAPGAGKSFYAVHHLVNNYYTRSKDGLYHLKSGVTVVANIEGLRLEHLDFEEVMRKSRISVTEFFSVPYQTKVVQKHGQVVYVIDECQRWFDQYFRDKDCIYFFEYHRHLGLDIYLMSQTRFRICRSIADLAEYEIRAVRRFASLFGEFKYNVISGSETVDKKVLKKDKALFRLYRSMDKAETEKIKNPMIKYLVFAGLFVVIGIFLFFHTFWGSWHSPSNAVASPTSSVPQASPSLPTVPLASSTRTRFPVRLNFVAVGNDIQTLDYASNQLLPLHLLYSEVVVTRGPAGVRAVHAILSPSEFRRYNEARFASHDRIPTEHESAESQRNNYLQRSTYGSKKR